MVRRRLARRLGARRAVRRRHLALDLGLAGLRILKLQFELFNLVLEILGFAAELPAPRLGDHQCHGGLLLNIGLVV